MQYLLSIIHDSASLATPAEMAAIVVFNTKLQADGNWVFAGGLGYHTGVTLVDNRGGDARVSDAPFEVSKEYLAGFWIITASGRDAALALALEGSKACNRKIEMRPFL